MLKDNEVKPELGLKLILGSLPIVSVTRLVFNTRGPVSVTRPVSGTRLCEYSSRTFRLAWLMS